RVGIAVVTADRRSIPEHTSATGQLTVNQERTWHIGAITTGRITDVFANVGDRVHAGQVLAHMHSHEVHDGRADYRRAQAELAQAKQLEEHALRLRDRARRLFELKAMAREQVDRAETEYRSAQSAVRTAETELQRHRIHLTEYLDVALEPNPAKGEHDHIPIKAPAAGLVIDRK